MKTISTEMPARVLERFNAKFRVTPGCWLWTATKRPTGYGQIRVNGRTVTAHRLSHEIHIGVIPAGLCVLHKCDVPACVNPDHLFLGSHADNMVDRDKKGRGAKRNGESNGLAKLTAAQVLEIRALEMTLQRIADIYNISNQNVSCIKRRVTWSHIA